MSETPGPLQDKRQNPEVKPRAKFVSEGLTGNGIET
jgi:hypothetical protein